MIKRQMSRKTKARGILSNAVLRHRRLERRRRVRTSLKKVDSNNCQNRPRKISIRPWPSWTLWVHRLGNMPSAIVFQPLQNSSCGKCKTSFALFNIVVVAIVQSDTTARKVRRDDADVKMEETGRDDDNDDQYNAGSA